MSPLANVRILDFTHVPPGQFCSMMLGDMGAEVLRVEQPPRTGESGGGDVTTAKWEELMGSAYGAFNRNKKSITLNLKDEEARQVVYRLVEATDVMVEGFRDLE